jgi:SGNH hydrolase-like domain, acetyltransferase AlgX
MKNLNKIITVFLTSLVSIAFAFSGQEILQKCPQLRNLDKTKYGEVSWVIGSSTERMFINTQFVQNHNLSSQYKNIKVLSDLLEKKGSHLLLVPIPNAGMYFPDILDQSDPLIKEFDFSAARNSYKKLVELGQKNSIHVVGLDDTVKSLSGASEEFFFDRDTHWTPSGALFSAVAIKRYIETNFEDEYKQLTKSEFELVAEKESEVEGFGAWAKTLCDLSIPNQRYQMWTSNNKNLGLFDDLEYPIVVLGDSYGKHRPGKDLGFEHFLASQTQLNIDNESVAAGKATAAAIRFFSLHDSLQKLPKFVVWLFSYSEPPDWFYDEVIPSLAECKNPIDLVDETYRGTDDKLIIPGFSDDRKIFLKITNVKPPLGINLQLEFVFNNQESYEKTFIRHTNSFDISDSKNFFTFIKRDGGNKLPIQLKINTPIDKTESKIEICSMENFVN